MAKGNLLTDAAIRKAKPDVKHLNDGNGLYLDIRPTSKLWRIRYTFNGKEGLLSGGEYPAVSLKEARELRDKVKEHAKRGINPSAVKAAERYAKGETLEAVAREWWSCNRTKWTTEYAALKLHRLEQDIFPWLGHSPIATLTPIELLSALRRIEARGVIETAHRILQTCSEVFRYAVITQRAERDITVDLRGALKPSGKDKHHAAILEPAKVGELLRAIDGYKGPFIVRCALKLSPLVFVRPGELRHAKWSDIDLDAARWAFAASKTGTPHIVPLCTQALAILRELQPLTGGGQYVFPGQRTKARPMSENTVNTALRAMGFTGDEMTGHGFRALARTLLDERLRVRADLAEKQLAHSVRDPLGRAYNRTTYLDERADMMQAWADYLDQLRQGGKVIRLKA